MSATGTGWLEDQRPSEPTADTARFARLQGSFIVLARQPPHTWAIVVDDGRSSEVRAMFSGTWCGGMGVGGWLVMILFWATFLGLAVWAVTSMFPPARTRDLAADPLAVLDRRLAAGELDPDTYRRTREELADAGTVDQGRRGP